MLRKTMMFLLVCSTFLAQSVILKPNNEIIEIKKKANFRESLNNSGLTNVSGKQIVDNIILEKNTSSQCVIDTLSYKDDGTFNTNFGFFGGDVMMQYFVAPTDMILKYVGFSCSDDEGTANADIHLRVFRLNWSIEQLESFEVHTNIGVFPSEGDGMGSTDPFGESATGNWIDFTSGKYPLPPWSNNASPVDNTFQYDLWSDAGSGYPITPIITDRDSVVYQWVDLSISGVDVEVKKNEVFAVVFIHSGNSLNEDRIGFWSDGTIGIPGWKYYEGGRLNPADGWWVRDYTWDFAVIADLIGDRGPKITNISTIGASLSTDPVLITAKITDDNPYGGPAGVANASLNYVNNYSDTQKVSMSFTGNDDIYEGYISNFNPCVHTEYWVTAEDINGNSTRSRSRTFFMWCPSQSDVLLIFNGSNVEKALELGPLYLQGVIDNSDTWAYGPVNKELLNNYYSVVEVHSENGPEYDNREALRYFVETKTSFNRGYFGVIGQDVLGHLNNFKDSTFKPGDYEYDILGVNRSYNDVNYDTSKGIGNNFGSPVRALENTNFGDALFTWVSENNIDTILYDPNDILGSENWMDQFDPREDINSEVFMTGYSLDGIEKPVGHYFEHSRGSEVFFMSLDPLALDADSNYVWDGGSIWVGGSSISPLAQYLMSWIIPSVEKLDSEIPNIFSLSQNYPNPFNPTTTINYSIPLSTVISNPQRGERSLKHNISEISLFGRNDNIRVRLTVYDILGREVATLVNQNQKPGNYKVEFNASKLTSGVYFYQLNAGEFLQSKKMLLIK